MVPVGSMATVLSIDGCTIRPCPGRLYHRILSCSGCILQEALSLKILEAIKRSGLFMPWPNTGDPVCQGLTQRLWTNRKMAKTPSVAIDRVLSFLYR